MNCVRVVAPATTANLGPGFDVLALALTLYDVIELACSRPQPCAEERAARKAIRDLALDVEIAGEGADSLPKDKKNLVFRAAAEVFLRARLVPKQAKLRLQNNIPLARGLGSSAAATVGGLLAANRVCHRPLANADLLRIASEFEGHPDNVAATFLGGLTAALTTEEGPQAIRLPLKDRYRCVAAIPSFELRTVVARRHLPSRVSRSDAIFSLSREAVLCGLLAQGAHEGLAEAMKDRLHQPKRAELIPGLMQVIEGANAAGASGAALSGAGPTVIALIPKSDEILSKRVSYAMEFAFRRAGVEARTLMLDIDMRGACVRRKS